MTTKTVQQEEELFKKIKTQLDAVAGETTRLSEWEENFITSISDQFTVHGKLTLVQEEKLEQIYRNLF